MGRWQTTALCRVVHVRQSTECGRAPAASRPVGRERARETHGLALSFRFIAACAPAGAPATTGGRGAGAVEARRTREGHASTQWRGELAK